MVADGTTGRTGTRGRGALVLLGLCVLHLLLAWPAAIDRGVITEEIKPYLLHYPKELQEGEDDIVLAAPYDDPELLRAVDAGEPVEPRWVGTQVWPEVGYHGEHRVVPVFVRGHQTAVGTWWGILFQDALGGGLAGVRRSSVLMGVALVALVWGIARRLGLSIAWAAVATLGVMASPGVWFFGRTGYGYELASRTVMLAAIFLGAKRPTARSVQISIGLLVALAILCRATIAVTLVPPLALLLISAPAAPNSSTRGPSLAPAGWGDRVRAAMNAWSLPFGVGFILPVVLAGIAVSALPFDSESMPGGLVRWSEIPQRTLVAPLMGVWQLSWVVDGRVILLPLFGEGEPEMWSGLGLLRIGLGGTVAVAALVRWRRGGATLAEKLFCAGLFSNALLGAWLYGRPSQFQLGMALEPLFVLALVAQCVALERRARRLGIGVAGLLLSLRLVTLSSTAQAEARSSNPMLSGSAQRQLLETIEQHGIGGNQLVTTTYDYPGMLETLSGDQLRPIHAWRVLKKAPHEELVGRWQRILDLRRPCGIVLTRAPNLVEGPFTDNAGVRAALREVLSAREISPTIDAIEDERGVLVFELWRIPGCAG
jgi:hypothetical protein